MRRVRSTRPGALHIFFLCGEGYVPLDGGKRYFGVGVLADGFLRVRSCSDLLNKLSGLLFWIG